MYASTPKTQGGGIFVTHNLSAGTGATFTQLPAPTRTDKRPNNIHLLDDGTIIATYCLRTINDNENFTETSGVFVSTDGGQTWHDRSHDNMRFWTSDIVIDPHDPTQNRWYTAVHGHQNFTDQIEVSDTGGLYRTTDRGQTWTRILSNTQAPRVLSVTIHPTNPDVAYVATGSNGLLMTSNLTDANPTFTRDESYPFRQPVRIFFNPFNANELWTITNGSGMLMRTLDTPNLTEWLFLPLVVGAGS
jgi:hypothetical protein